MLKSGADEGADSGADTGAGLVALSQERYDELAAAEEWILTITAWRVRQAVFRAGISDKRAWWQGYYCCQFNAA